MLGSRLGFGGGLATVDANTGGDGVPVGVSTSSRIRKNGSVSDLSMLKIMSSYASMFKKDFVCFVCVD